jgi:SAM-dependent methyltransferase
VAVSVSVLVALSMLFGYPLVHDHGVFWSPYYEVSTQAVDDGNGGTAWTVSVNGIPHQRLTSVATRSVQEPWYLQPYREIPRTPRSVLIVGAGTGTDVAIALHQGAHHVDAVEIDPTLLRFGRQHDPDNAYADPRVSTHVDDGRAFLDRTDRRYDLVVFALPDSLTLVSGAGSLRLESYLFTEQAFAAARAHLAPGGAFAMYNFYREQWLVDRLAGTLDDVFGHPPCVYQQPDTTALAVLTVGRTPADQTCARPWVRPASTPAPATDDRPFVYLEHPGIPALYLKVLALIIVGSAAAVGLVIAAGGGRRRGRQLRAMWGVRDLFLLGAAFLLMETKSVTGFALLFGTTWVVNALVFAGVLTAVLAAVEVTRRLRTPPLPVMYVLLLATLALNWLVPSSWLLSLPLAARAVTAVSLGVLPIFAANVIFAKRFADTSDAPLALATNLLGAIVGGCLEYLSLIFGNRALLIVAGLLYTLAYVALPRRRSARPSPVDVSEMSLAAR